MALPFYVRVQVVDTLPAPTVITLPREIAEMISITKGAVLGQENSGTRGRKAGGITGKSAAPKGADIF
jgi:hypothetical protein